MNDQILEIINNLKGSLLGIGVNNDILLEAIENNDDINICYLLNNISLTGKKFSITKRGRNKKINIKKIKKHFKKKSLDAVICNYDIIKQFQRSFIPSSIYINKGDLYIYGSKNDLKVLEKKYQRYTNDIKFIQNKEGTILKINNRSTKNNWFKDTGYKIKDWGSDTLELITDILIN